MDRRTASLVPLAEMARRLHVTTRWLRDEVAAGRIPALDAGGRLLFRPERVEALLVDRADRMEVAHA